MDEDFRREAASHASMLSPEEARQGVVSGRVMTSLALCVVAFAILYAISV